MQLLSPMMKGGKSLFMITILMATYNGQKYLSEQLDSILKQTLQNFIVFVSDDCSDDGTWDIVQHYVTAYPKKIKAARREKNSGNAKYNFFSMMAAVDSDYIMLCDQDDVWLPDKIDKTLARIKQMEGEHGKEKPLLVHTDLCVVDRNLREINASFREAMNVGYMRTSLNHALIQNTLTGCTVMYNRALSVLLTEIPRFMVMHDWFLMLVASAFGEIGYLDEATILYRQHGNNEVGANDVRTVRYKLKRFFNCKEVRQAIYNTYPQAESFLALYGNRLTEGQRLLVAGYCEIPSLPKWRRWRSVAQLRTYKNGAVRNLAYFIFI